LTLVTSGSYITDQLVSICMTSILTPTAAAPRQRRKEARPQELLDAALELFAEKGFAATRSEEVAARAGVAKGTLYLYYPSKEELLKAVISQRLSQEIAAGAEQVQQFTGPTSALLTEVLSAWWQRVFDSPVSAVFKLVITEVRNFPEIAEFYQEQVVRPGKQLIGRILERGIRSGEFRPLDVPSAVLSLLLPMVMLCLHKHSLGACAPPQDEVDPHAFIRNHVELVLGGLLVAPPPAARRKKA
jgi:AcrR family transcriptional regulator